MNEHRAAVHPAVQWFCRAAWCLLFVLFATRALAGPFAYVLSDPLLVVDLGDNSFVTHVDADMHKGVYPLFPVQTVASTDGNRVLIPVAFYQQELGAVRILDTATQSVTATVDLNSAPRDVVEKDGIVYVAAGPNLARIRTDLGNQLQEFPLAQGYARYLALSPDGMRLYVATVGSANVSFEGDPEGPWLLQEFVTTNLATPIRQLTLPAAAISLRVSADGAYLYTTPYPGRDAAGNPVPVIDKVTVYNTSDLTIRHHIPVPQLPLTVTPSPVGSPTLAYVFSNYFGELTVIDPALGTKIGALDFGSSPTTGFAHPNNGMFGPDGYLYVLGQEIRYAQTVEEFYDGGVIWVMNVSNPAAPLVVEKVLTGVGHYPGQQHGNFIGGLATPTAPFRLAPDWMVFSQPVQSRSIPRPVTVSNVSGSPLSISISARSEFAIDVATCAAPISPGQQCTFKVAFEPVIEGGWPSAIRVAGVGYERIVNLNTWATTGMTVEPPEILFAPQLPGTESDAHEVTLTNATDVPIAITSIGFDNPAFFLVDPNACGVPLAPSASCKLQVKFKPPNATTQAGTLTIVSDANGTKQTSTVTLSGDAIIVAESISVHDGTPQSKFVHLPFTQRLEALVLGTNGLPLEGAMVTFTAETQAGASATFADTPIVATKSNGIATSPEVVANGTPGTYKVLASVSGVTQQAEFTLTNLPITADPASITVFGGTQQTTISGQAFPELLRVIVKDGSDKPLANVQVTFVGDRSAVFVDAQGATSTVVDVLTDSSGVATSPTVVMGNAIDAVVRPTATVTETALAVTFELHVRLAYISATFGTPQYTDLGKQFRDSLVATVRDQTGSPLAGVPVKFEVGPGPAGAFFWVGEVRTTSATAISGTNGLAEAPTLFANDVEGKFQVYATGPMFGSVGTFNLENINPPKLVILSGNDQATPVGTSFPSPVVVHLVDKNGNDLANRQLSVTAPPTGPAAIVPTSVSTDGAGRATFTLDANGQAGTYPVFVIYSEGTDFASDTLNLRNTLRETGFGGPNSLPYSIGIVNGPASASIVANAPCSVVAYHPGTQAYAGCPHFPAAGPPASLDAGVVQFTIEGLDPKANPGQSVTVTLTFPNAQGSGPYDYWKYGREFGNPDPQDRWYKLPGAMFSPDGKTVTFMLTDGGIGDSDGIVNGVIQDPGGPALRTASPAFTSAATATFMVGRSDSFKVVATGIPAPKIAIAGALPAGLTFDPATGSISGVPKGQTEGKYAVQLTASNGIPPDARQAFTVNVVAGARVRTSHTTLAIEPSPSTFGQATAVTAMVTARESFAMPTGSVEFLVDTAPPVRATLVSGRAHYAISSLAAGPHAVVARYLGDAVFEPSASTPAIHVVGQAPTQTTLTSDTNPASPNALVTFSANVVAASGSAITPSGQVRFVLDGKPIATVALDGGRASHAARLSAGSHQIVVSFLGSANHAPSDSAILKQVVRHAGRTGRIAFVCDGAICIADEDGTALRVLTHPVQAVDIGPLAFSPDGTRIAFRRLGSGDRNATLWLVDADSGAHREVAPTLRDVDAFAWSPAGDRLAAAAGGALHFVDARTGATQAMPGMENARKWAFDPVWSPDGKEIAFAATMAGDNGTRWSGSQIYRLRVDGTAASQLTPGGYADTTPSYSTDGQRIEFLRHALPAVSWMDALLALGDAKTWWLGPNGDLFSAGVSGFGVRNESRLGDVLTARDALDGSATALIRGGSGKPSLCIVDARGTTWVAMPGALATDSAPAWAPDNQRIAFAADGAIYVVDREGRGLRKVTPHGQTRNTSPVWAP